MTPSFVNFLPRSVPNKGLLALFFDFLLFVVILSGLG
jgi:hypothetical protein